MGKPTTPTIPPAGPLPTASLPRVKGRRPPNPTAPPRLLKFIAIAAYEHPDGRVETRLESKEMNFQNLEQAIRFLSQEYEAIKTRIPIPDTNPPPELVEALKYKQRKT